MLGRGLQSLIPPKNDDNQSDLTIKKEMDNSPIPEEPKIIAELPSGPEEPKEIAAPETPKEIPANNIPETKPEPQPEIKQDYFPKKLSSEAIFQIETEKIKPNPFQPRRDFDEEALKELAASIREFGIIQPLIVSKIEKDTESGTEVEYQLIAGERRLKAAKILGWERVPAIIKRIEKNSENLEMAIIENLQRENLNPIETARAYAKLQDQFGLTQREVASRLGKSREAVANTLRILNLPTEIQNALAKNQINESQARLLLAIPDQKEQQTIFNDLISNHLSVRELKSRIRKTVPEKSGHAKHTIDPETKILQQELSEALGAEVNIEKSKEGGKIIITFYSSEEIQGILNKINPNS